MGESAHPGPRGRSTLLTHAMRPRVCAGAVAAELSLFALAACGGGDHPTTRPTPIASSSRPSATHSASASPTTSGGAAGQSSCPATYSPPDPNRPQVSLSLHALAADHRTVTGHERVVFTPDRPDDRARLPAVAERKDHFLGGSLPVSAARIDGRSVALELGSAGGAAGHARAPCSTLPLGHPVAAGQRVTATWISRLRCRPLHRPARLGRRDRVVGDRRAAAGLGTRGRLGGTPGSSHPGRDGGQRSSPARPDGHRAGSRHGPRQRRG